MLLFGCHCISISLPLEKRGLSGIRTRDVVMNDLGMVWGFDGYDAAPGSRVTALQRAMPAIKNQLCIYVSASMNFFFFFSRSIWRRPLPLYAKVIRGSHLLSGPTLGPPGCGMMSRRPPIGVQEQPCHYNTSHALHSNDAVYDTAKPIHVIQPYLKIKQ